MLGYSSYLDKSMNGIKTLTDGISIIQNGNASFNSITTNNINIDNIANCDLVNCTTSTTPTIANSLVNKTYCDSNFCDLTTSQIIAGSKTFSSILYLQDIYHPTKCIGALSFDDTIIKINSKKVNGSNLVGTGTQIKFYVSPRIGLEEDLAFMIQGNYGTTDPLATQCYVSGAFYVCGTSYLKVINTIGIINTGAFVSTSVINSTSATTGSFTTSGGIGCALDIFCGGKLTISGTTTLSGQVTINNNNITGLTTLTSSPVYPDSSNKIASTQFVSANFVDVSTVQNITGEKLFSNIVVDTSIKLKYTTVPNYPLNAIGFKTYQNGGLGDRAIPNNTIYDVLGGGTGISAGTWNLEYCVTIVPNTSININSFISGFSASPTVFTNYSGFDATNFKMKLSLSSRVLTKTETIQYSQIFVNTTGNMNLYLLAICVINSGSGYYYNPLLGPTGPYPVPSCYIQATRIG